MSLAILSICSVNAQECGELTTHIYLCNRGELSVKTIPQQQDQSQQGFDIALNLSSEECIKNVKILNALAAGKKGPYMVYSGSYGGVTLKNFPSVSSQSQGGDTVFYSKDSEREAIKLQIELEKK